MNPFMRLSPVIFLLLVASLGQAAETYIPLKPGELRSNLIGLFNKESSAVTFTYLPEARTLAPSQANARRFILIQVDEKGSEIRRLGPLMDDGILGDAVAHDGVYSRKFQLNQKKPGVIYFSVQDETGEVATKTSALTRIEVLEHPAIQALLKRIWARIKTQWSASSNSGS